MAYLRRVFFRGLIALLPVALTLYLILWLARGLDSLLRAPIQFLLPDQAYFPGMGLVAVVILIFALGLVLQTWVARRLWQFGERILDRMPMVRAVFRSVKELVGYIGGSNQPEGQRAVLVSLGDGSARMLGLVTRESTDFLAGAGDSDQVAVFLPWSYQVGGFTVFVPASRIERVDLTARQALQLALTAGVGNDKQPAVD